MKQKLLLGFKLRASMLVVFLCSLFAGQAWGDTYELATSLTVGDNVVLVNTDVTKELGSITTTGTTYGNAVTVSNSTPAGTNLLTVIAGSTDGSFAFKTSDNKYLSWSSGNSLTTDASVSNSSSWNISFSNGVATITNVGTSGRKLQYNSNNPRFACYTSNQTAVKLYKRAIPTHTLAYSATNGSIGGVVYGTSTAVATGANVAEGGKVTLTATPSSGYVFSSWNVSGTGSTLSSTSTNPTTFTMGTANATVTAIFTSSSTVATPSFTVAEGTYNIAQSVELNCGTDGATIYYTTDGTDPTTSSSVYSSAIAVNQTTTIKAFAVKDGLTNSSIASATYTLKCAAPTFDPVAGSVGYGSAITLATTTAGATIYYTTNGDTPTSSSSAYDSSNKPTISGKQTFKAIATKTGWSDSDVSSAAYTYYYVITAESNNDSHGTVSGTTTITATPADGYRVVAGDGGYTVTSGTATVTNNGDNTFTVTPTSNCTVQINFEAIPTHTVTFFINGDISRTATVAEGCAITFPTAKDTPADATEFPKTSNGKTFVGWYTAEYSHASTAPSYVNTATATMSTSDVTYYAVYADYVAAVHDYVSDELQLSTTGVSGNTYTAWSNKSDQSAAKYAGQSAGGNSSIQLRNQTSSGIITTTSGGILTSVTIDWNSSTTSSRYVTIYGNNSAYTASSQLYSPSTRGTSLGTIVKGTSTELEVSGSYSYLGILASAAIYINKITVKWDKGTPASYSNFTTDARSDAGIAYANAEVDVKLTSGYTGQELINDNSVTVTYSSSDESVATVNSSTGVITELLKAGSTTITASFAGNATYKPSEASYTLNVTEKTPAGLAYAEAEVAKVTTDAAFTNTLTNGYSLTISYSSSATGVATVNASTGEVTVKGAGETTITASFAGNEDYEAGNASYTLTVSKATPTLSFESENAIGRKDEVFAGNALTNPAGLKVIYSSSDTDVATIDENTGTVTIVAAGTTTITASFAGNDIYTPGSASYTLKVLANPTITVSNQTVVYGNTFTVVDSDITGGAITVTSGNSNIATVDGLEITPVACGEVIITVSTAEDDTYKAGEATFTLTVTAPAGSETAPNAVTTTTFTDKDLNYSSGGVTWSASETANSFEARGVQFGAAIGEFTLSTSAITGLVKKISMVVSTNANDNTNSISVKVGDADFKNNNNTSFSMPKANGQTVEFTGSGSGTIVISCNDASKSIYFKSIAVTIETDVTVTLNKYGYATFCSVNPIDFSSTEGYTAWRVNSIASDGTITFKKITGSIKGGQGVLLYNKNADGVNTSDVTIKFADGSTVFDNEDANDDNDNLLYGTTAPTYMSTNGDYYGLKGNEFVPVNAGTVPAGKALLPADVVGEAKALTFVFEDETDGIKTLSDSPLKGENVCDLNGRRIQKPTRGIYVKNGKKIVIK